MIGKLAAIGALVIAVGLWLVLAWPASQSDTPESALAEGSASPAPTIAPPPAAEAAQLAAPSAPAEPASPAGEATPQPLAAAAPTVAADPISTDKGPVAEYRERFESEPRDRIAPEYEKHIAGAFAASSAAPGLLKSVVCRETICKVELRWNREHQRPYMQAITRMGVGGLHGNAEPSKYTYHPSIALSPIGDPNPDGVRLVELYVKRAPPSNVPPVPKHEH